MRFIPFQAPDLARLALHDGAMCSWDMGLGKGIAAIAFPLLKLGFDTQPATGHLVPRGIVLLVAPGDLDLQVEAEAREKFGIAITRLDKEIYQRLTSGGIRPLPHGFYFTSYTELTRNGAKKLADGGRMSASAWLRALGHSEDEVANAFDGQAIAADSEGHYKLLSVPRSADFATIARAYKALCKIYHPDTSLLPKEEATEKFKQLGAAYDILKDPLKRAAYNRRMGDGAQSATSATNGLRRPKAAGPGLIKAKRNFNDLSESEREDIIFEFCRVKYQEYSKGIGENKWYSTPTAANDFRIRCVYSPTLADLAPTAFDCVVVNEGVRMKGGEKTLMGKGLLQMDPRFRLVLTGTPIKNRLWDVFWLLWWAAGGKRHPHARWPFSADAAEQDRFSETFLVTEENLTRKKETGKRFKKRTSEVCNVHGLWKLIAPLNLRRTKADCGAKLVNKLYHYIHLPMGTDQAATYEYHLRMTPKIRSFKQGMAAKAIQLKNLRIAAANPCSGLLLPVTDPADPAPTATSKASGLRPIMAGHYRSGSIHTPKLAVALKLIHQIIARGEQFIVFSPFHDCTDGLSRLLGQARVDHLVLDGRTNQKNRATQSQRLKSQRVPGAIAGLESMAEGHSFPLVNNIIIMASTWAMDKMLQCVERAFRINSVRDLNIYVLITDGTVEIRLKSDFAEKNDSAELVLDGRLIEKQTAELSTAELLDLAHKEFHRQTKTISEDAIRDNWPELKAALQAAARAWKPVVSFTATAAPARSGNTTIATSEASGLRPLTAVLFPITAPTAIEPEELPRASIALPFTKAEAPTWKLRLALTRK